MNRPYEEDVFYDTNAPVLKETTQFQITDKSERYVGSRSFKMTAKTLRIQNQPSHAQIYWTTIGGVWSLSQREGEC